MIDEKKLAEVIGREVRRQIPEAIERYARNPLRRSTDGRVFVGGETIDLNNGPARRVLPEMLFEGKTALWVGCHQDQNGSPLVCISVGGQLVPIATVEGLEGLIGRYREQTSA